MYRTVIVGFDGSDDSEDALKLGGLLAKAAGSRLVIVYIHQAQPQFQTRDHDYQREIRDRVQGLFERARAAAPEGVPVETESFASGLPAQGLRQVARAESDALLVLGPTHHGPLGRVVIGSVGEQLLEGAPCSVTVAPRGFRKRDDASFRVIGVAFDGSPESREALRHAHDLGSLVGGEVRALAAKKKRNGDTGALEQAVEEVARDASAAPAELSVLSGDPARALSKAAKELDLLLTGSRGHGPVRQAMLGSVSAKIMRNAPCPVLIVPRGVSAPTAEPPADTAAR
jgi:nucleotide-binding universal stress UspA family protein